MEEAKYWICSCGHENSVDSVVCAICGKTFREASLACIAWQCSCGQINHTHFCTQCGIENPQYIDLFAEERRPRFSFIKKISAVSLLLVFFFASFCGVSGYTNMQNVKRNTHNDTSQISPQKNTQKDNAASQAQPTKNKDKTVINVDSDLSLGGLQLCDSLEQVRKVMGKESSIEHPKDGNDRYQYPGKMEVVVKNGTVTALVSGSKTVKTKRGIHEGSTLSEVLSAYGKDYLPMWKGEGFNMYEYAISKKNGEPGLLRFAVDPANNQVKYISVRTWTEKLK